MGNTQNFFAHKKEWSVIKDAVFDYYLSPYIPKILATHKPLVIVDCFAGKGKFDDGSEGSPLIISRHIKEAIDKGNNNVLGIFIEKKYVADLKQALKGHLNCEVWDGTFEKNLDELLKLDSKSNVFVYIDPYGIKSLDFNRFEEIKKKGFNSLEMLLNFNAFGFLREACRLLTFDDLSFDGIPIEDSEDDYEADDANTIENMNRIANGDYWKDIVERFRGEKGGMIKAEELFVDEYVKRFKHLFSLTVNIPVRFKTWNIPKYRLIFGTNNADGLILMTNNMNKKWTSIFNDYEGKQALLFAEISKEEDLRDSILKLLPANGSSLRLEKILVLLIEKHGISYSEKEYKDVIRKMAGKEITIKRDPEHTPTGKKATSLDQGEYKIYVWKNIKI